MKQGYIIIATGNQRFMEMSVNLALSLKHNDGKRHVALVHDNDIFVPEEYGNVFDYVIQIPNEILLKNNMNKLNLYDLSPFEQTMYIDSDCFLAKKDIDLIWDTTKDHNFTVVGRKIREGIFRGIDVKKTINNLGIPYIVYFNSGVIYFDKSETSKDVFKKAKELLITKEREIGIPFRGALGDETFLGVAMGFYRISPIQSVFKKDNNLLQWMQCVYCEKCIIHVMKGVCYFESKEGQLESPTIPHFVGFCQPIGLYIREANRLREKFGLRLLKKEEIYHKK